MEPERVSPREREVLELLGDHLTHEEIGQRLFISVRTVESHVASLRRKLGLPDHRAWCGTPWPRGPRRRARRSCPLR